MVGTVRFLVYRESGLWVSGCVLGGYMAGSFDSLYWNRVSCEGIWIAVVFRILCCLRCVRWVGCFLMSHLSRPVGSIACLRRCGSHAKGVFIFSILDGSY